MLETIHYTLRVGFGLVLGGMALATAANLVAGRSMANRMDEVTARVETVELSLGAQAQGIRLLQDESRQHQERLQLLLMRFDRLERKIGRRR